MKTSNWLPWKLITKNLNAHEQLQEKIREKISKLETHLQHFPPDTIHLQISLSRNVRKQQFTAALTLRLPSNILHSEKSAPDLIKAFDDSVRALLREIQSFKAELRHEALWKRKHSRQFLRETKAARFAPTPLPKDEGPQKLDDLVRDLFQEYYPRLVRHVRRHVRHDESIRAIPRGALNPNEIVDEAAQQVITHMKHKPGDISWLGWFYQLVAEEFRKERGEVRIKNNEELSLDQAERPPEEEAEGYDAEQPLEIIEQNLEPFETETRDVIADGAAEAPDQVAARHDLFVHLQKAVQSWPEFEREVFELHFVEGFEPDEIAMIVNQPVKKVNESIEALQAHLREEMLKQAML